MRLPNDMVTDFAAQKNFEALALSLPGRFAIGRATATGAGLAANVNADLAITMNLSGATPKAYVGIPTLGGTVYYNMHFVGNHTPVANGFSVTVNNGTGGVLGAGWTMLINYVVVY